VSKRTGDRRIAIGAWRKGERLHLRVEDNGPGLPAGWSLTSGAGIGLGNTEARLRHLYGDAAALAVSPVTGGGVRVDLTLPYRST
jgi:sensor histidine kinase YesM